MIYWDLFEKSDLPRVDPDSRFGVGTCFNREG